METIRIYLENMFSRLPRTPEIIKLENDMLRTMEDKYEELKMEGKSENEAIGIVISEFGNIDELIDELGLLSTAVENGARPTETAVSGKQGILETPPAAVRRKALRTMTAGIFTCPGIRWSR